VKREGESSVFLARTYYDFCSLQASVTPSFANKTYMLANYLRLA